MGKNFTYFYEYDKKNKLQDFRLKNNLNKQ